MARIWILFGDLFPCGGFLRLRSSRGCTSQIWRIPVEPLALVHACHRHCVGTRRPWCVWRRRTDGSTHGRIPPCSTLRFVSLIRKLRTNEYVVKIDCLASVSYLLCCEVRHTRPYLAPPSPLPLESIDFFLESILEIPFRAHFRSTFFFSFHTCNLRR